MTAEKFAGIWRYTELPSGMRTAVKEDLLHPNGRPKIGTWFLIHCEILLNYQAYRVKENFDFEYWRYWLDKGRMYVKVDVNEIID